jgi:hypothetical protein
LAALPVGERAPVQGDGVGVSARGQVGGGELVPRAERVAMPGAADSLTIGEHALEDGDGAVELAGGHESVAQAEPRSGHIVVIRPEVHGLGVQQPLKPGDGVVRAAGRQVGLRQPLPDQHRVWMPGGEQLVAGRDEVAPVVYSWTGQAGVVQAVPGP